MRDQKISVTVDAVIFYAEANELQVVLVQRKNEPFKDQWALPGGFLEVEEALDKGAARELKEETGLEIDSLTQIGAFGAPGRDPRGRIISVAFLGKANAMENLEAADDARDVKWFNTKNLPSLAFDHSEVIEAARKML